MLDDLNNDDEILDRFRQSWCADESYIVQNFVKMLEHQPSPKLVERLILLDIQLRLDNDQPVEGRFYPPMLRGDKHFDRILGTADTDATQDFRGLAALDSERTTVYSPSNADTNVGSYSGMRIRYSKLREHAAGGLGKVFVAADHELKRQVALKTIQHRYRKDSASQKRFVLEAQVTGALEHPGIVPVYSLNVDNDGIPYYTMRFVEGKSLKEEIAEFHSSPQASRSNSSIDYQSKRFRSLIKRFIDVCYAIHFAHSKGILHRDLKPDNIMLGSFGESLVVDWGLAKVLRDKKPQEEGETISRLVDSSTMVGARLGTPVYMSPEQALGFNDRLTPATDIYSLGATLFTLLTSDIAVQGESSQQVIEAVASGKIRSARDVFKGVPWALDAICRKAMARAPEHRYGTAKELADDLESWMADEPISTQTTAEPITEKVGRLVRRYRSWTIPVVAAATTVLFVLVAAALLINQSRRSEAAAKTQAMLHKSDAIDRYRQSQNAINQWLVTTSRDLQYFPATTSLRKSLLESAVQEFEELASSPSKDPDLELERVRAQISLGDIFHAQPDPAKAEKAYADAFQWANAIALTNPARQDIRAETYRTQGKIATVSLELGGDKRALQELSQAVEGLHALCHTEGSSELTRTYLAEMAAAYTRSLYDGAQYDRVIDAASKYELSIGEIADQGLAFSRLATIQISALTKLGDYDGAMLKLEQVQETLKNAVVKSPDSPPHLEELAFSRVLQAELMRVSGREELSILPLQAATEDYRTLVKALPDIPIYKESLGKTFSDTGLVYFELREFEKAKTALLDAKQLFEELVQYYPLYLQYRDGYAVCLDGLAQCEEKLGNFEQAEYFAASAGQLIEDLARQYEPQSATYLERTAIAWSHRAAILAQRGNLTESRQLYTESEQLLLQLYEAMELTDYANALGHVTYRIAELDFEQDKAASAQTYFEKARQYWSGLAQTSATNRSRYQLAWFYVNCPLDEYRLLGKAIDLLELNATPELRSLSLLGEAYALAGRLDDAGDILRELESRRGFLVDEDLITRARIQIGRKEAELASRTIEEARNWHRMNGPGAVRVARKLAETGRLISALMESK